MPTTIAPERRRIIKEATAVLEDSDAGRDPEIRRLLERELNLALDERLHLPEISRPHQRLVQLATACVDRTGGLRSMAECLDFLDTDPGRVHKILRLADEWHALVRFSDHNLLWLRTDLAGMRLTAELRDIVVECHPESVPDHCESAWQAFTHLAAVSVLGGQQPWLRFLEQLITRVPARSKARLEELFGRLSDDWQAPATAGPAAATPGGTAYLIVQFEKYGADDETFIMRYWHQWASPVWEPIPGDSRHVLRTDLETAVDEVVRETERRWADKQGSVIIEFVLPSELLNEPVDMWRSDLDTPTPRRLAIRYPLVIRSLERIRAAHWHRAWRNRWRIATGGAGQHGLAHFATADAADVELEAALQLGDGATVVLGLSDAPRHGSVGSRQLSIGLMSGLPVIIWFRPGQRDDHCEALKSMVSTALISSHGVTSLPQSVAELRRAAWQNDPHATGEQLGHGLVLLWDDPDRKPGHIGRANSDTEGRA